MATATGGGDSPAQLVEHGDVGVHVVDVVGVGRVLGDVPLLGLGALGAEHVAAVLGLIVHAVEARHLGDRDTRTRVVHTLRDWGFWVQAPGIGFPKDDVEQRFSNGGMRTSRGILEYCKGLLRNLKNIYILKR